MQIPGMQIDSTPQSGPVPTPTPVAAPGQSSFPSGPPPPVVHIGSAPAPAANTAAPKVSAQQRPADAERAKRETQQKQANDTKLKAEQQM